jgi:uncharacterized protein
MQKQDSIRPFHLAIPVKNLDLTRKFYRDTLGCIEGRSSDKWVDFNFFGHQFVIHQVEGHIINEKPVGNKVDGKSVPVPHFGVVLDMQTWKTLASQLETEKIEFIIEPYIRFEGQVGEQATMFLLDPENNALEFKAFDDIDQLFAK